VVDLCPAEADHGAILLRDEETFGIEPTLGHPVGEIFHLPTPLIGVVGENAIIESKPRFIIYARNKGGDTYIDKWRFNLAELSVQV
jgi:hypothetical protein